MKKTILSLCLAVSMAFSMTSGMVCAEDFSAGEAGEIAVEVVDGGENAAEAETSVGDNISETAADTGNSIAEISAAEEIGDSVAETLAEEEAGDGISDVYVAEDTEDGITDAEETGETETTEPTAENADEFSDSEDGEVLFVDGEAAADLVDAGTTVGLGVASHTAEEIVAYMKNNGATLEDEVTYDTEPGLTVPYSAGVLSDETKKSALAILNNVRYIAGLSEVTLDDTKAESQQAASIVSAANGGISHYPTPPDGMSNDLYSLGYYACREANLGRGYATLNKDIVQGWMAESCDNNIATVGHRRWCLNPSMGKTAFGAVMGESETCSSCSNFYSMYAHDKSNTTASETLVAWPAQQMPLEYFGDDYPWSLSVGKKVTASDITVTLTRGTESWSFSSSDSTDGYFTVNNGGYGQKGCIIFRPNNITYADGDVFTVTVTGLDQTVSYTVNFFKLDNYWHTHVYNVSGWSLSEDDASANIVYTCACGDTYTATVATTITTTTEAACETDGQNKISFKDRYRQSHIKYRTIPALGHNVTSISVNNDVISGTCSRCGKTISQGVVTGFLTFWKKSSDDNTSLYSTAVNTKFAIGDTLKYWISENYLSSSSGLSDINKQFVAESSNTDVISVSRTSDTEGILTMNKGGLATITFYPKYNTSLKKTFIFTVSCGDGNHTTELRNAKAATCVSTGYTGDQVCTVCETIVSEGSKIPAKSHTTELRNAKKATCTTVGYTGDEICTVCGAAVETGETIPVQTHSWGSDKVTKATLTRDGKIVRKCTVCGKESRDCTEISHPAEISLSANSYTFDNRVKTPGVVVKSADGNLLSEGADYAVKYVGGRKNVGTYKVLVIFCGNYSGTAERTFTILPKGTSIRSLKTGKKRFTVTLKKQKKQTTGYQVQYSTSKNFRSMKLATIKKNSTTKAVYKKLKSGKKYYVRVRTYMKVNGITYYSAWSKTKSVKVK